MFRPFKYIPLRKLPFKYLPPNFATAANMIVGFLAIIFAIKGKFEMAAWLVVLAVFLDGIDGMLARILKAQSHFGIEFDSFSDFVSFGIAPASVVLCYLIYGDFAAGELGPLMWISIVGAIFYALMAAIRLARFNVQTIALGDRLFQGIPTTACAGIIATFYLTLHKYGNPIKDPSDLVYLSVVTLAGFGFLMVSKIPLLKLRRRKRASLNVFERCVTVFCLALAVTRRLPDILLVVGMVHLALGIRYGAKLEKDMKKQKESSRVILEDGETLAPKPRDLKS